MQEILTGQNYTSYLESGDYFHVASQWGEEEKKRVQDNTINIIDCV